MNWKEKINQIISETLTDFQKNDQKSKQETVKKVLQGLAKDIKVDSVNRVVRFIPISVGDLKTIEEYLYTSNFKVKRKAKSGVYYFWYY